MAKFKVVSRFHEGQSVWFLSSDQKITNGKAVGFQGNTDPSDFYPKYPVLQIAVDTPMSKATRNQTLCEYEEVNENLVFTSERKLITYLKRK